MIQTIWSASALLPDGWAKSVEITLDKHGNIIQVNTGKPYSVGERIELLIPGIPNVHSHAHQRAMAGLGERATALLNSSICTTISMAGHSTTRLK
jgi:formimidoylglutamate deiminase